MPPLHIVYYASDASMGDTPPEECQHYRQWALSELSHAFPDALCAVEARDHGVTCWTDDEDRREEIATFCAMPWDRCPWDWTPSP